MLRRIFSLILIGSAGLGLLAPTSHAALKDAASLRKAPVDWFDRDDVFEVTCLDGRLEFRPVPHLVSENVCHPQDAPTLTTRILVVTDESVVGPVSRDGSSGAGNILDQLPHLPSMAGVQVASVSSITQGALAAWLTSASAVVLPRPVVYGYDQALTPSDRAALKAYVQGGGLVLATDGAAPRNNSPSTAYSLNGIFGFNVVPYTAGAPVERSRSGSALAPILKLKPDHLQSSGASTLTRSRIPSGTEILYDDIDSYNDVAAAVIPLGKGNVAYLGWNFVGALPHGRYGSDWYSVMDSILGYFLKSSTRKVEWDPPLAPKQKDPSSGTGSPSDSTNRGDRNRYDDEF